MTTAFNSVIKNVPSISEKESSYRIPRVLTLDEEARENAHRKERTFRQETHGRPYVPTMILGGLAVVAAMFILGLVGNLFLDTAVVLQGSLVVLSLHTTRRVFSLMHAAHSRSAAYLPGGAYRRYFDQLDAGITLTVALLVIMQFSLSVVGQTVAAAVAVLVVFGARYVSESVSVRRREKAKQDRERDLLTAGM